MLFEGQSTAVACEIVDAARIDLSSRTLINKNTGERLETVSFSAGIADVTAYDDAREALRAADAAMYDAKADGRNRVYIADRKVGVSGKSVSVRVDLGGRRIIKKKKNKKKIQKK